MQATTMKDGVNYDTMSCMKLTCYKGSEHNMLHSCTARTLRLIMRLYNETWHH